MSKIWPIFWHIFRHFLSILAQDIGFCHFGPFLAPERTKTFCQLRLRSGFWIHASLLRKIVIATVCAAISSQLAQLATFCVRPVKNFDMGVALQPTIVRKIQGEYLLF